MNINAKIPILTFRETQQMLRAGEIAAELKKILRQKARPGVTTQELDELAEDFICQQGAVPAFKGFHGYPATLVTCLNEEVVHGIPGPRRLAPGDLLTIDLGAIWQGFYSDTATTFAISQPQKEKRFLETGQQALELAIRQCVEGKCIGDISHAIQTTIEAAGYGVVRLFTGHGVGKILHQPPEIPGYGSPRSGPKLKAGMGLAIEVMATKGKPEVKILSDGWTTKTIDGRLSVMFEETVIVGRKSPLVTTL